MGAEEKKSTSKVGFGSGDFKGRGALFDSVSRNRHQHANRMEDEFYCHEDHSLDDFQERYGHPNSLSLNARQKRLAAADDADSFYDRVLGSRSQTAPCFLCKFDQYTCRHRHPMAYPKESVIWPSIASHDWGWYIVPRSVDEATLTFGF